VAGRETRSFDRDPEGSVMSKGWTLGMALAKFLDGIACAEITKVNHEKYARALLRFFGERPIGDFSGPGGGKLVMDYVRGETGDGDRGLRETFGGSGALARSLSYDSLRNRLRTLRLALNCAVRAGELRGLPDPWPVPPSGSHGHLNRGLYLLATERAKMIEERPPRKPRPAPTVRATGADAPAPTGVVTLSMAIDWFLQYGTRRLSAPTVDGHKWQRNKLLEFFGDRPLTDFEGGAGYRLLWEYLEAEGPGGRGAKFCSLKKRLTTLRLALKEANRLDAFGALPPWPDLPNDSVPRERYLTYEEYSLVRAALPDRARIWLDLAIWTGMHTSDVNATTWAMVDLGAGPGSGPGSGHAFWFRRNTKNGTNPVWLPMPDELRAYLVAEWRSRDVRPAPADRISGPFDHKNLRRALNRATWKTGIPQFSPIDCRRTCATWWIERQGPKDGLKSWLGHTSTSGMVDKHYAKVTPMTLDQGVAALNRAGSIRNAGSFYADPRSLRAPVQDPNPAPEVA
jgi:integrase